MTAVPLLQPERAARMWRAFRDGSLDEAYDVYRELTHTIHAALGAGDYPQVVKAVLRECGVLASDEVRPPLVPLAPARRAEVLRGWRS
jgi:4-hydroxy-tetrahydrodipicolinate synthase